MNGEYFLLGLVGSLIFVLLLIIIAIVAYAYRVYRIFKDHPELEDDPHWEEGFSVEWYADQFKMSNRTAQSFLDLAVLTSGFSREEENGKEIYKMNMKKK